MENTVINLTPEQIITAQYLIRDKIESLESDLALDENNDEIVEQLATWSLLWTALALELPSP